MKLRYITPEVISKSQRQADQHMSRNLNHQVHISSEQERHDPRHNLINQKRTNISNDSCDNWTFPQLWEIVTLR